MKVDVSTADDVRAMAGCPSRVQYNIYVAAKYERKERGYVSPGQESLPRQHAQPVYLGLGKRHLEGNIGGVGGRREQAITADLGDIVKRLLYFCNFFLFFWGFSVLGVKDDSDFEMTSPIFL
jgi:hypothetical protein